MKKITKVAASALAVASVANAVHAATFKPKQAQIIETKDEKVDIERYRANLSKAIQIPTVSYRDTNKVDWAQFENFHKFLDDAYPLIKENLTKEIVPPANLIYCWKGSKPDLEPIALLAHQDVVPVSSGTENDWEHPAFSGYDDGEFIWGRGAIDMKNHLICIMESIEALLADGFVPERDTYLLFGDNEEIVANDKNGAKDIMNVLKDRGIHFESIIDEGGAMLNVDVKGVLNDKVLAGIGVSEKGFVDVEISVPAKGGHSSQPPKHTALGQLAKVITRLEKTQFKAEFNDNMKFLLDAVARNTTYPVRLITCNIAALRPALLKVCQQIPVAACMVRTTTAVTIAQGSPASNVLPQKATAVVNFRTMPGVTVADVLAHVEKIVKAEKIKDAQVTVTNSKEASPFSPTDSRTFKIISGITKSLEPNAIVSPFLVMGGTDSCNYETICENVYRFGPFRLDTKLLLCAHATNERFPIDCMAKAVTFFKTYVKNASLEN